LLVGANPAQACENETGADRFGKPIGLDTPVYVLKDQMTYGQRRTELVGWADRVLARARENPDFSNLNELAVVTTRLGRPKPAIRLLLALERQWPGRYETATNLGTALELAGADAVALRWIREGIRRNPGSHEGSEWLHVRILEAKVAGKIGSSMLGLDYGYAPTPQLPGALPAGNDGKPVASPAQLARHLVVQLGERVQFVPPRDPVVAALFFDWGNVELASGSLQYADVAYDFARRYGHADAALLARRHAEVKRLLDEQD
jgi:hypothetical protein